MADGRNRPNGINGYQSYKRLQWPFIAHYCWMCMNNTDTLIAKIQQTANIQEAEKLLLDALQAEPDNVSVLDYLSYIHLKQADLSKAKDYLDKALAL